MVRGWNEVILKGLSNPSHSVVPCYLAYPGFDNLSVYFFPLSAALCPGEPVLPCSRSEAM